MKMLPAEKLEKLQAIVVGNGDGNGNVAGVGDAGVCHFRCPAKRGRLTRSAFIYIHPS